MCGIVGAVAQRNVTSILIEGLKRLEYRGYDSAGVAVISDHEMQRTRMLGKVLKLAEELDKNPLRGNIGISHTRWATHGQPSQTNAHPHLSGKDIAVVHNGIIENYRQLRDFLIKQGYQFESETDTEVVAHLIHYYYQNTENLNDAIYRATQDLRGAYALGIISRFTPNTLYAVRRGSPLAIGIGIEENFIASDPQALLPVTQQFIYLEEGDIAKLEYNNLQIFDSNQKPLLRKIHTIDSKQDSSNKGPYRHFMIKEIFDQPQALVDTIDGYILSDQVVDQAFGYKAAEIFDQVKKIIIVACGTSYHAGLVARHWLEEFASVSCQVEIASENRYRNPVVEPNTLLIALSQSGETADTLAAFRRAKQLGYLATLAISNVPQSSLMREADLVFQTRAGTEIGVAATKTFTAQLEALLMLTTVLTRRKNNHNEQVKKISQEIIQLPNLVKNALSLDSTIRTLAKRFIDKQHVLFLGRGSLFPIALEGALKLKEISYLHAEAYPAGELKHGPLALIDNEIPVIILAPNNHLIEKLASNIEEVQARGGELYIFSDDNKHLSLNNHATLIEMPSTPELISPIIYTIPMQLLAYHIAVLKGTDVDQPRNLAKSVTVE